MGEGRIRVIWWMISMTLMFFGIFFFIINPIAGIVVAADSAFVLPLTRDRLNMDLSEEEVAGVGVMGLLVGFGIVVVAPDVSVIAR